MLARFGERLIYALIAEKQWTVKKVTNRSKTMTTHKCETEFDFTLLLEGIDDISQEVEDALFEAGCDDATISLRYGRIFLTFSRSAVSLKDAIISAINDVKESNIPASVLRVDQCDLVTQAEIARRIERSRELVRLYISGARGPGGFPTPVCNITDGAPLWYWCEVAYWLWQNNIIKEDELRDAQDLAVINSVLELERQRQVSPQLTREVVEALSGLRAV